MDYPLINGNRYSFSSIELTIGTKRYIGFKEVTYSTDLEPGEVRGAHAQLLGRTRGDLKQEASLTMYEEEWNELLATLGDGFHEKPFDLTVSYAEEGRPTVTDTIMGNRIKKIEKSRSQGTDPLEVKLDLHPMIIKLGGKNPLKKML